MKKVCEFFLLANNKVKVPQTFPYLHMNLRWLDEGHVPEKQLLCIEVNVTIEYEILIKYLSILKDKWINFTETLHRFQEILEFPIGGFHICIRGSPLEPGPMPWVEIWIDPPPPPILALAALPLGGNGVGGCTETETEWCDDWYFKFVLHFMKNTEIITSNKKWFQQ